MPHGLEVPPATGTFEETIQEAKKNASKFGDIPLFLSECLHLWDPLGERVKPWPRFFNGTAQGTADQLAVAVDQGVNAVTYWQYADTNFTGQPGGGARLEVHPSAPGWFMYPESVTSQGKLIDQGTGALEKLFIDESAEASSTQLHGSPTVPPWQMAASGALRSLVVAVLKWMCWPSCPRK